MKHENIKLLVLDVHGVVLTNPLMSFLDQLARATGQSPQQVRRRWRDDLRTPTWTGQITDDEVWEGLAGESCDQPWRAILESQYAPGPAASSVPRWSQQVPVWLLSNHRRNWLLPRLERFELAGYFESVLVSDVIGSAKPDAAAFRPILDSVVDPASVLFVDDRKRNVAAAERLGLPAIHAGSDLSWLAAVDAAIGSIANTS